MDEDKGKKSWKLESPIYNDLTTNLPKQLMRFTDLPFPDDAPLMPGHEVVRVYLEEYARSVEEKGLVRWGRRVTSVVPIKDESGKRSWEVTSTHVLDNTKSPTETFDAVIVANGHYTSPFIPDVPGIREWCKDDTQPRIIHSKSWRHPPTTKMKILIIGAGISGMDIADMIAKSGSQVLLASRTFLPGGFMPPMVTHRNIKYVHPVSEFITPPSEEPTTEYAMPSSTRAVRFKDGHVESEIDQVILATGYFYDFPFFSKETEKELGLTVQPESRTRPVNAVLGLWQHLIARDEPTLSFLGIPSRIVPFPVVEVQSAVVARLLAGRLTLPSKQEMLKWETEVIFSKLKDAGTGLKADIRELIDEISKGDVAEINRRLRKYVNGDFHILWGTDAQYINGLSTLCSSSDEAWSQLNPEQQVGKKAPYWNEKTKWMRRMTPIIQKIMREGNGELIERVKEIEEVVGTFEHWMEVEEKGEEAVDEEKKAIARKFEIGAGAAS